MKIMACCPCGLSETLSAWVSPRSWEAGEVSTQCSACGVELRQQGNHFDVLDYEMPLAVGVLQERHGQVLGVSRKNDHTAFGVPGGKVDPTDGEITPPMLAATLCKAAARELKEECGVVVDPDQMEFVYQGLCPGGEDGISYWMTILSVRGGLPAEPTQQPGEGLMKWIPWETLEGGPFAPFCTRLHQVLADREPEVDVLDFAKECEYIAIAMYSGLGIDPDFFRES